jgi:small subunit ribosomal protein S2
MLATVYKSTGSWYQLRDAEGNAYQARIKGKFKIGDITSTNPVAVGDLVTLENEHDPENTMITEIHERKNYITRVSPHNKNQHHIIASNLDQSMLFVTFKEPRTSLGFIDRAYDFVKETVAHGGSVMFVGTKKQGQEAIAEQATRVGMPYVNHRWLGGMLTNFSTVHMRLQRLKELELIDFDDVAKSGLTKKELLVLRRERDKLAKTLGGIREMSKIPSAIWVVDTKKEHIAVGEARKLGIPVIAVLDTNCDPDEVDFPIPGNDDAIRSVALLTRVIADAVAEGLIARAGRSTATEVVEPLAEWERELLAGTEAEVVVEAAVEAAVEATPEA